MPTPTPYIDALFMGELRPFERLEPAFPEYNELCEFSAAMEGLFAERLTPELRGFFQDVVENRSEIAGMLVRQAFADGYRLGVNLMLESLGQFALDEGREVRF